MNSTPNLVDTTRSEWLKFRSVRASLIGVLTFFVLTVGLAVLVSFVIKTNWNHRDPARQLVFDPVTTSLVGVFFGQFAAGVMGARFITSEYASGGIRTSLAAVPQRWRLSLSKVIVLLVVFSVLSQIATFLAFSVGQVIYKSGHLPTGSLSNSTDLRAVVFAGVYLVLLTLIGYGLGLLLRTTATTISVFVAVLFIVPIIMNFLPSNWQDHINKFLPSQMGAAMMSPDLTQQAFSWGTSALLLTLYTAVLLVVGTVVLTRRDA